MPRPLGAALQIREAHPAWAKRSEGKPRTAPQAQRRLLPLLIQNPKSKIKNHKSFSFFPSNASPQPSGEKSARPAVTPYQVGTD
jgi:hypothetical protein